MQNLKWLKRFWRQPNKRYRNFQIVYTILTLNFAIPAFSYYTDRDGTIERARKIGELLGSPEFEESEKSHIWWILGSGNVATLAFMCFLLQFNLRRYRPALPALLFLKAASSIGYGALFAKNRNRFFAAASTLDAVTTAAMAYFATAAFDEISASDEVLVPEPIEL